MLNLLKSVAVGDQTVASNIATLDNIMSGVDGAATFGYTLEAQSLQVSDNQKQQYAHTHTLDIRVIQGSAGTVGILDAIVANNRQAKITAISPDGFLLWDDPSYLVRSSQFDQVVADQILVTKTQPAGYAGTAPNRKLSVYAGDNALALYDVLSGSANTLNGFTLAGGASGSVSGGNQTVVVGGTTAENTVYLGSANIFFPFVGETLTASFVRPGTSSSYKVGIEWVQSNGTTVISTSLSAANNVAGTYSVTAQAPANTVYMRMVVAGGTGLGSGNSFMFNRPMIAIGTNTSFTL
jgi:hypothetical protein